MKDFLKLFLIIFVLFSSIYSQTVTVESAEYEDTCNLLGSTQFKLIFTMDEYILSPIDEFEIAMVKENSTQPEEVKTKCIQDQTLSDTLVCQFNATEIGTYHPKLAEEIIVEDEYKIAPFELFNYSIGFSDRKHIPPSWPIYNNTVYLDENVTIYIVKYQFTANLDNDTLPTIKIDGHKLNCTPDEVRPSYLNCFIDYGTIFTKKNYTYIGEIINVCGMKEADLGLILMDRPYEFYVIVNGFSQDTPQINCGKLEEQMEFSFDFRFEGGEIDVGVYPIYNQIKFIHAEDETTFVETSCLISTDNLRCTALSSTYKEGVYYAYLADDYRYSKEDGDFVVKAFRSQNSLNINTEYIEVETKELHIVHDYADGQIGNITFQLGFPPTEPLTVKINRKYLMDCSVDFLTQTCHFNKEILPSVRPGYVNYTGNIMNACGNSELEFKVDIMDSSKIEILLTKTNISETKTVEPSQIPFSFILYFKSSEKYDPRVIDIGSMVLASEDESKKLVLSCENDMQNYFICSRDKPAEGTFKIMLLEDYEGEFYVIKKWTSEERITFTKDYTKPTQKEFSVEYNYSKGAKGIFSIDFEDFLGTYLPSVKFEEKVIDCQADTSSPRLNCAVTKDKFPESPEKEMIYEGNVFNPIGVSDAKITLTIAKQGTSASKYLTMKIIVLLIGLIAII